MRIMARFLLLSMMALHSVVITTSEVHSEPLPRADQFFEHEFIKNAPLEGQKDGANGQSIAAPSPFAPPEPSQQAPQAPKRTGGFEYFNSLDATQMPQDLSEESPGKSHAAEEPLESFIPIESLTLLMNGSQDQESAALLNTMATILKKFDIQPKAIYTMQLPAFLSNAFPDGQIQSYDFMSIMIRGGEMRMNREIPAQYQIERLPTWIAETPEGDVILEGYNDISSFLNAQGELKRSLLISTQENINDEILSDQQKEETPSLSLQEKDSLFIENAKKQLLQKLRERGSQLLQ